MGERREVRKRKGEVGGRSERGRKGALERGIARKTGKKSSVYSLL